MDFLLAEGDRRRVLGVFDYSVSDSERSNHSRKYCEFHPEEPIPRCLCYLAFVCIEKRQRGNIRRYFVCGQWYIVFYPGSNRSKPCRQRDYDNNSVSDWEKKRR